MHSTITDSSFVKAFSLIPRQGTIRFPAITRASDAQITLQPTIADAIAVAPQLALTLLTLIIDGGTCFRQLWTRGVPPSSGGRQTTLVEIPGVGRWSGGRLIDRSAFPTVFCEDIASAAGVLLPTITHFCAEMLFDGVFGEQLRVTFNPVYGTFEIRVARKTGDQAGCAMAVFVSSVGQLGTQYYYMDFSGRSLAQLRRELGGSTPAPLASVATYLADLVVSSRIYHPDEYGAGWNNRNAGANATVLWANHMFYDEDSSMERPVFLVIANENPQQLNRLTGQVESLGAPVVSLGLHRPEHRSMRAKPFMPLPDPLLAEWNRIAKSDMA